MRALLLALCLLAAQAPAITVYDEDFSAYALASALTANPPNYVTTGSSGAWVVASGLSGQVAQNPTVGGANWAHAMYNGATYTYTDLSVRCKRGTRANVFARVTGLSAVNSIPTDGYQVQVLAGSTILYKGGYASTLGTWSGDPTNVNDYTVRLLCNGTSISVYIDGVLRVGPITDATYASGKVGIGTFASTAALFSDITVDDGTVAPPTSQPLSPYIRQNTTNFVTPLFLWLERKLFYGLLRPSSAHALDANTGAEGARNSKQLVRAIVARDAVRIRQELARLSPPPTRTPVTRPTATPVPTVTPTRVP